MRLLIIALALIASTIIAHAEDIRVINRFQPSSTSFQAMSMFLKKANSLQTKYNFIPSSVPGAVGENADQRALVLARIGSKVVWFGPVSSFTLNRFELGNTYDRDNDFYFIRSFLTTYQSIVVSKTSGIKSIDELVTHLKSKDKNFYGVPLEIGAAKFLNNIFARHYKVEVSMIKYKDFGEITMALNNKEIDYSIFTHPAVNSSLVEIELTKQNRNTIPNFQYETISSFAVPKEIIEFGKEIRPLFVSLCNDAELVEFYKKVNYEDTCYDDEFMKQRIKNEVELIGKFQ